MKRLSALQIVLIAASGSLALLMGAFFFQALGYAPCKMCLWQRWPHVAAAFLGALYIFMPRKAFIALGALSAAATSGLGAFHTGVEKKWWDGPSSCTGSGPDLGAFSGVELLPSAGAGDTIVLCDVVSWTLLGLSMASYNFIIAGILMLVWIKALFTRV
jgi:disulfide bond formation protein DsbB